MPFSRFMELCLYTPGWGYYSAGASKFGGSGDFTTAPELGSLFAGSVANALAPVFAQLGAQARMLELGAVPAPSPRPCCCAWPNWTRCRRATPSSNPAPTCASASSSACSRTCRTELAARVDWIDRPFEEDWEGVVFANEVIDALPTPRFLIRDGEVYEETVELDGEGNFIRGAQPADILLNGAVRHIERYLEKPFADGYRSEVLPQLPYWLQAVAGGLQRGAMLFVDYGYSRSEFYQHDRDDGTVRAFYRHHVHNDVHRWPGLQDITASVDFTAMAEAGMHGGFELAGYCSQASFLLGNGLDQVLLLAEERTDEVTASSCVTR